MTGDALTAHASLVGCTIVAHNYLPLARVVAQSFLDHHPGARFVVAIIDHPAASRLLTGDRFEVLTITDIDFGPAGFLHMATGYDVTEFATSVKPFVLLHLLTATNCVLYLDPDVRVFAPLDPLIASTRSASWSITPHCVDPMRDDDRFPSEATIMAAGVYNLGFIGVTDGAREFLHWWAQRLRHGALIDPANQLFTDQRWVDLAVPLFAPHIETSPAYNVAYWNIDQRPLTKADDTVMVGDEPLRFFHFSGYDAQSPWWLSKYEPTRPRALLSAMPIVAALCVDHTRAVESCRRPDEVVSPYGWREAFPGLALDRPVRRMFHREVAAADRAGTTLPPSPFAVGGAERFRRWLAEPGPDASGLPRFLAALWNTHAVLQQAFPEVTSGDHRRYWDWLVDPSHPHHSSLSLIGIERPVPTHVDACRDQVDRENGVDIVGYFAAEVGTGEAGRLIARALTSVDVPVSTISRLAGATRHADTFATDEVERYDTVLVSVNADQLGTVRQQLGWDFFAHRYVIGQWFWEVETFPAAFVPAFSMLHEVWVATRHIHDALLSWDPPQSIQIMPLPLMPPPVDETLQRSDFGLDERFVFLFSFDYLSVFERKNPMAVVAAFCAAFADGDGPVLVIKSTNGERDLPNLERLRWTARHRSDVVIIDGHMDRAAVGALTAMCDCYVSLHRAEGLGLTMSEAMALGKPVIATSYSGNMDFMTADTAFLVPWERTQIGDHAAPYPSEGWWAEPDVEAASRLMRHVVNNSEHAASVGTSAQLDLADRFSMQTSGRRMRSRLEAIWEVHRG